MQLTTEGARIAGQPLAERRKMALALLQGERDITDFTDGICYDAAAFIKYLIVGGLPGQQAINRIMLGTTSSNDWPDNLGSTQRWRYNQAIAPGTMVTFRNLDEPKTFHAAVAIGGTQIRAINGGLLGTGWSRPANLSTVLVPHIVPGEPDVYLYMNRRMVALLQPTAIGFDLL